jgi:hypothetical protein
MEQGIHNPDQIDLEADIRKRVDAPTALLTRE